jgi:tetratricopeptide (TPR) repeat protein
MVPPTDSDAPDVFVSYTQPDRAWAEWIAWELEDAGLRVVIQAWDFAPGSNFVAAIQEASSRASHTMAVLTSAYLGSWWTTQEWTAAFRQDRLIPIRVEDIDPSGVLGTIGYVDLVGVRDPDAARVRVVGAIRRTGRDKPRVKPNYPAAAQDAERGLRFPGSRGVWNVPPLHNRHFTGRDEELSALKDALAVHRVVALSGLGGMGKTQLAVQYAARHAADYDVVWWIGAEQSTTLVHDFAALAGALGLPLAHGQDEQAVVAAVRERLRTLDRWLLIFDNAADPASVRPFVPEGTSGHVLVTSRYAAWAGMAQGLTVEKLSDEAAADFLLRRTGEENAVAARHLAAALQGLPLALVQAAAYIETTRRSLEDYATLFAERTEELLAWSENLDPHDRTVATTWELSFAALQRDAPDAAGLLNLIAFLAGDDIPTWVVAEGSLPEALSALADPLAFDRAIGALGSYSLVQRAGDSFSVHRLVQAVARHRLREADEHATWANHALGLIRSVFSFSPDDPSDWQRPSRLVSHARLACSYLLNDAPATDRVAALLLDVGSYLSLRAAYKEAAAVIAQALEMTERVSPDDVRVAPYLLAESQIMRALGRPQQALASSERALRLTEAALDPMELNVGIAVSHVATALQDLGRLEEAKSAHERALTIFEEVYGPHHPEVGAYLNNLGSVLHNLGRLDEAKAVYERGLRIVERAAGPSHLLVAPILGSLGNVLHERGELEAAKRAHERAMAINKAAFDPEHPKMATSWGNLGIVLKDLGDLTGARAAQERALAIDEAVYGPAHPEVAFDLGNLSNVLMMLGDRPAAEAAYRRLHRIFFDCYGPDHRHTREAARVLKMLDQLR